MGFNNAHLHRHMMYYLFFLLLLSACSKDPAKVELTPIKKGRPVTEEVTKPEESAAQYPGESEVKMPEVIAPSSETPTQIDLPQMNNTKGPSDPVLRTGRIVKPGDTPDLPQMEGMKPQAADQRVAPTQKPGKQPTFPSEKDFKGLGDM